VELEQSTSSYSDMTTIALPLMAQADSIASMEEKAQQEPHEA